MGKWITIIIGTAIIAWVVLQYLQISGSLKADAMQKQADLYNAQAEYQDSLSGEWWFQISTMLGAANPLGEVSEIDLF